jgi:threonine aldolase
MKTIDFRSDTVTLPTKEMLEVILEASLGDDVYREDPTVNKLQDIAAKMFGKEKALFVTSGTQGNTVSVLSHTEPGDSVIMDSRSHIYNNELGGIAVIGGVLAKPIHGEKGILSPEDVSAAIRRRTLHSPGTTLICIENTHNGAGGVCWDIEQIKSIRDVARDTDVSVHMDGARVFNAAVALDLDVSEIARNVDSVMCCLSKGLCAPVGSVVVGDEEFIEQALRWRKMLGGGMRQAGILAAPGIIALTTMVDRLEDDHDNARILAEGLADINCIEIDLDTVQTNIVRFNIESTGLTTEEFCDKLGKHGIKAGGSGTSVRMVTHLYTSRRDIHRTLEVIRGVFELIS